MGAKMISPGLAQGLAERSAVLERVRAELKTELFGIDPVIDRVIESLRAWFLMSQIITRPVIICLWGLTGTGKTQLTRLLAQKLGFYDRFLEVQMDWPVLRCRRNMGFQQNPVKRRSAESSITRVQALANQRPARKQFDTYLRATLVFVSRFKLP